MKIVANFTNVTFNYCKQSLNCSYQGQCCSFESFVNYFALKNNNKIPVIHIYQSENMKTSRDKTFTFYFSLRLDSERGSCLSPLHR